MKPLPLPDYWAPILLKKAETGMGYYVANVRLRNGTIYRQVVIDSGFVANVRGFKSVPFDPADIVDIDVTHEKWDWRNDAA
jgi:hypothetical protein